MAQANSKFKFDEGKIQRVLALIIDISDYELGILINRLREEQNDRNMLNNGPKNRDTIQT